MNSLPQGPRLLRGILSYFNVTRRSLIYSKSCYNLLAWPSYLLFVPQFSYYESSTFEIFIPFFKLSPMLWKKALALMNKYNPCERIIITKIWNKQETWISTSLEEGVDVPIESNNNKNKNKLHGFLKFLLITSDYAFEP